MFEVMLLSLFNLFSRGFLHSCHDFVLQKKEKSLNESVNLLLFIISSCTYVTSAHNKDRRTPEKINVQARLSLSIPYYLSIYKLL